MHTCPLLSFISNLERQTSKEKNFLKRITIYQSDTHQFGLKLRLGRQPMEALKEAPSCKPAEGLKKAPKAPLESSYLGEETLSEARL